MRNEPWGAMPLLLVPEEGLWAGEDGSLERIRTLRQLAEIQRNTSVFE